MRRLATVLITAFLIPLLNCCTISYKFNGSAIDYNVYKTIHVGQFPIRAALVYPPLQQMFENALLDYIARNTRLQIVDTQNTDITLDGEITGYNLSPQAVSENAIAAQTRLTISVRVKYTDSKNDKNNVDQTFSAYKDFDSNEMLTDVQDDLCQQITEQLIDLIFNATLGNW
ncbi:LptE family protein [uncultured Muribaculum sp.]|uniref:LptE family protein n=1 Tax=uncultured Muribaculum sp. TaxID=1918613 RepID=UPI0026709800|nr:LptE family protein [uncultured Muribaculum sp.]